jgi:hypothetical protein
MPAIGQDPGTANVRPGFHFTDGSELRLVCRRSALQNWAVPQRILRRISEANEVVSNRLGLPGEEGTFNMCSFWLVEALTRAGLAGAEKLDHARLLFERVLGYANHLGVYAEQTGSQGEALGNFPQALHT